MSSPRKKPEAYKPGYSSLVPAVEQASRILLALAQNRSGTMTLTEICNEVGIHKSKGFAILNTLQHFAFVQRETQTKHYSLGPGLLFLSNSVLSNLDLRKVATPILRTLATETDSTAFFGVISGGHVLVVAKDEGGQDVGVTIRLGHRFPLAWGAHGKSILAFSSEMDRKKILRRKMLYFHGEASKFDGARLEQELAMCREVGFAADLGDMKAGIHAVASAVFGPSGKLIGSLVVLGTFPKESAAGYGAQVAEAAREFSESIGGSHEPRDRRSAMGIIELPRAAQED
jgi:DNA-binding IclR family transcriptional regulator